MPRGKNTTIGKCLDLVQVKSGIVLDDKITRVLLRDLLNHNVTGLARRLREINVPIYLTTSVITLSGSSYPITSLAIDKIEKLVDSSLGPVDELRPSDFENVQLMANVHIDSLFFTQEGEYIRIFKGTNRGAHGTLTLHYHQIPAHGNGEGVYPDLPDSFTSILIDMICSDVYAYKNGGKRDPAKEKEISDAIASVKQSYQ